MADRPTTYTADRADRVTVGKLVHMDLPTLTTPAPTTGWVAVTEVDSDANGVLLSLTTGAALYFARDRLLYQG